MRRVVSLLVLLVLISCTSHKQIVSDAVSAVKITEKTLCKTMDSDELESFQPFKAVLIEDRKMWQVYPQNILEYGGLVPVVYVT